MKQLLSVVLIFISLYDFKEYIIPNELVALGIIINLLFSFNIDNFIDSFVISFSLLIIVLAFNYLKKEETMGMGDIKLIFMLGLYLNAIDNIKAILISCVLGIIIMTKRKRKMIPFGPCLCIGYFILIYLK